MRAVLGFSIQAHRRWPDLVPVHDFKRIKYLLGAGHTPEFVETLSEEIPFGLEEPLCLPKV